MTHFEVYVGNVGQVFSGRSRDKAVQVFETYSYRSQAGLGRAAYESVTLFADGEILEELEAASLDSFEYAGFGI